MFTQRQKYLEKALLSAAAALLLLTRAGQSATPTDILLQTTLTPALSDPSLTTQLNNSSMEEPQVLRSHRSCGSDHEHYCKNGGECMYPQNSDKPFCICTASYSGMRCLFFSDHSRTQPELEQLIGIIFGVAMLIILTIIICCFACKRCVKSSPLIKSAPSETSV